LHHLKSEDTIFETDELLLCGFYGRVALWERDVCWGVGDPFTTHPRPLSAAQRGGGFGIDIHASRLTTHGLPRGGIFALLRFGL